MFKKSKRYSFKKGLPKHVYTTPLFVLRYQRSKDLSDTHVAVVVSKKVAQLATRRNKIKRKFIQILKQQLGNVAGFDFVFYLKKSEESDTIIEKTIAEAISKSTTYGNR